MPSPFPGVDPFVEAQNLWRDFDAKFLSTWQDRLLLQLPDNYDARIEEDVYVIFGEEEISRSIIPDIAVEQTDTGFTEPAPADPTVLADVATATLTLPPPCEVPHRYLQILRQPERTVVAVLELLSPTNKGTKFGTYVEKRDEILDTGTHLVEVDLLLGGRKLPMREPLPPGQFHVFISRGDQRPKSTVGGWTLRQRLPRIPIPLLGPDERVVSDLQDVFDTAWERGRYDRAVDYGKPIDSGLSEDDRNWVAEIVAARPRKETQA